MTEATSTESATLDDRFLEDVRNTRRTISVYLANGFQLKGTVVEFDRTALLFRHKEVHQLVMRSAVASMYPTPKPSDDAEGWWRAYAPARAEG